MLACRADISSGDVKRDDDRDIVMHRKKVMRGCDGSSPCCDLELCRLSDFLSKRSVTSVSRVAEDLICIQHEAGPVCIILC